MVPPIPYYFISYNDPCNHLRLSHFRNKFDRYKKIFHTDLNIIKVNGINPKEGHLKAIREGIKKREKQIIILEDDITFVNPSFFKQLTHIPFDNIENHKIIHLGGYLEDKTNEIDTFLGPKWINGHSRSYFAYIVNLDYNKGQLSWINSNEKDWGQIIYENSSIMYSEIIVHPYGYNLETGLMNSTLNGLSICKFTESIKSMNEKLKNDNEESQLSLNFYPLNISDNNLPRITLITTINDQRLWWALLRLNLDNFEYPTNKIKWLIVETTKLTGNNRGDTIEDILPKKRGHPGGWQLEYIQKEEWNGLDFLEIISKLKEESNNINNIIEGEFIVEFNPDVFYTVHSIMSRVKIMLKYPNIKIAGTVQHQFYDIKSEKTYLIGNYQNLELDKGSRITRNNNNINKYDFTFNDKIRIPSEFVLYKIGMINNLVNNVNVNMDKNKLVEYKKNDKFPDFLVSEDYFTNLIIIFEDLKNKIKF
jgi:hypothetical protein